MKNLTICTVKKELGITFLKRKEYKCRNLRFGAVRGVFSFLEWEIMYLNEMLKFRCSY